MGSFIKYVLAVVVGIFLFFGVLLMVGGIAGALFGGKETVNVKSNSILVARFDQSMGERTLDEDPIEKLKGGSAAQLGIHDIKTAIQKAADDDKIEGILLNISLLTGRMASLQDIRNQIIEFKSSGKFVYAYSEGMTQMAYYLASAADKIYVNPSGLMELKGFSSETMYFKGMLDKLGVQPEIYYAGKFKSATEPFRRTGMSEENRKQVTEFLQAFHDDFVRDIALARNLSEAAVNDVINGYKVRSIEDAVNLGIIDGGRFYDEVVTEMKVALEKDEDEKLNAISLSNYVNYATQGNKSAGQNRVAVVYAEGEIVGGNGAETSIGSDKYAKILRKLRKDKKVKAVVMRVNSPGGSALASDVIWRELELIKQAGKPLVTSMGDLAASGGYFIACNSDKIYAEENTITGSIGVFGMFATLDKLFEDNLGITFDRVKTAPYADFMGTVFRPLESEEGDIIQTFINDIYDRFLQKVSTGRNLDRSVVEEIAQGRVYTGDQAIGLGLVDEIGGLESAIAFAAQQADLEDYKTKEYPIKIDPVMKMIEEFSGKGKPEPSMAEKLINELPFLEKVAFMVRNEPFQMRLPYAFELR